VFPSADRQMISTSIAVTCGVMAANACPIRSAPRRTLPQRYLPGGLLTADGWLWRCRFSGRSRRVGCRILRAGPLHQAAYAARRSPSRSPRREIDSRRRSRRRCRPRAVPEDQQVLTRRKQRSLRSQHHGVSGPLRRRNAPGFSQQLCEVSDGDVSGYRDRRHEEPIVLHQPECAAAEALCLRLPHERMVGK